MIRPVACGTGPAIPVELMIPSHPFWFCLTWLCILWYGFLVLYVGWKGLGDIRRLIADLKNRDK